MRRSSQDKHLVWLLERGVKFDGESYISLQKFEKELSNKKKILSALQVQKFAREGEMVRIVPVEAPHNYTADITLRKGNKNNQALPVVVKKANVDIDYPYLTKDIAKLVGKDQNWVAKTFSNLKYKGDSRFHQTVRASSKSSIQKYSEAALNELKGYMRKNPHYNPYITEKENREKHGNNRSKNIST